MMPTKKTDDAMKQQLAEMEQNWKRALADYQNLVKRTQEQQGAMRNFACISLIERLLPAIDHLELAATHLQDSGLKMVVEQFQHALTDEGVTRIEAANLTFDPQEMECVELVEGEADAVVEVVTQGYRLQQKVIRPARVKVGNKNNNHTNNKEA